MTLKNTDLNPTLAEVNERLLAALGSDSEEQMKEAFGSFTNGVTDEAVKAATETVMKHQVGVTDNAILAERGLRRKLTSAERAFFTEAARKQKITGLDMLFPETIIEDVYRNLVQEHPIISLIDTQQGEVKTTFIYGDPTKKLAFWSEIPADINQILLDGFKKLEISASMLSGYVAMPKGYYKLGPDFLANYVVTFLREVMAASLEEAIINGDGKNKPLGMMRKHSGDSGGVYPEKEKLALSDLKPKSLSKIRGALSKAKTDNGQVVVFVNPETYWSKLYPSLAYQTPTGAWVTTHLPTGEQIIQSKAVPINTLIFGVPKNYLLVVAAQTEIQEYRETLAIQNLDLHIAQFYGKGIAKNENAFFVADISGIDGTELASLEGPSAIVKEDTINPKVSI